MKVFPIRNDSDLKRALARVDELAAGELRGTDADEIEIWATLIEAYEATHHQIPAGDPVAVIKFKMDELGLSVRALARKLDWGSGRVSEILNRQRPLTLSHVRQLARVLEIPAGLLVGEEQQGTVAARTIVLSATSYAMATARASLEGITISEFVERSLADASDIETSVFEFFNWPLYQTPTSALKLVSSAPPERDSADFSESSTTFSDMDKVAA